MALEKWQEYVDRLGRAEIKLRKAINEWRKFKKLVVKQRYENSVPDKAHELFQYTPYNYLDQIQDAKTVVKFFETKIEFYMEIEKNGMTQGMLYIENEIVG